MTVRLGLATRVKLAKLMVITGSRRHSGDLPTVVREALAGGVEIVQLRSPVESAALHVSDLRELRALAGDSGLVSAYGTPEYADAAQVDLLQLSALDGPSGEVRAFVGPGMLLGRSCHSATQVDSVIADPDVDFFTVSPVFNATGIGEAGLELVRHAAARAPLGAESKPWFAVGGVTADSLDEVLAAGARRVGVTRAILEADDPGAAAADLHDRLTAAWNADPGSEQLVLGSFGGETA